MTNINNLCECGCGEHVRNRYRQGHNKRIPWDVRVVNFWERFDRTSKEGHWLWTGPTNTGYGMTSLTHAPGGVRVSHLVAYELLRGPIPDGLQIDHLCRVRLCGNPEHLEPVTCRENLLRGETLAAANAAKTHCPNGHAYDEGNTHITRNGSRSCRECAKERQRSKRGYLGLAPPALRTQCPKGHLYDAENTRWYQGRRYCKECSRRRVRIPRP